MTGPRDILKFSYILFVKRRTFILSTIAGAGVLSASAYYFFSDADYDPALAEPQSLAFIWDTKTINSIGNQYRAMYPDESSKHSLVKLLNTTPTDGTIANDFATGKTVIVDGWLLSVTEARQCALSSLEIK